MGLDAGTDAPQRDRKNGVIGHYRRIGGNPHWTPPPVFGLMAA